MPLLARLKERAKALDEVKVTPLIVVIFFLGLAAVTAAATGIAFLFHGGVKSVERSLYR